MINNYNIIKYIVLLLIFIYCSNSSENKIKEYNTINYYPDIYISKEYIFNNEGLNKPWLIKENQLGEVIVLDVGNLCFYVFSKEGKYLRSFSRIGQGPGEMLEPRYFDIDYEGNIYLIDNGNKRISIFNSKGVFISSFRIENISRNTRIRVNKNKELLINIPQNGYFITVFSNSGKIIRQVAKLPEEIINMKNFIEIAGFAHIFMDNNNNYYIFEEALLRLEVYDIDGKIIKQTNIDELLQIPIWRKNYIPPNNPGNTKFQSCSEDIIMKYDKYYLINKEIPSDLRNVKILNVFVIDFNLKLINKYVLNLNEGLNLQGNYGIRFDVIENGKTVLLPLVKNGEIILFNSK